MDFDVQLPYTRGVNAIPRLSFLFTTQQPLHLDENLLANVFLPPPFINYITRVIISVNKAVNKFRNRRIGKIIILPCNFYISSRRKILASVEIYGGAELLGVMLLFPGIVNIGPAPQVAYLYYREIRDTMPTDRVTTQARLYFARSLLYACMTLMTHCV